MLLLIIQALAAVIGGISCAVLVDGCRKYFQYRRIIRDQLDRIRED